MKELKRQNQMEILKKGYKIFVLLFSIIIIAYSCRDGGVAAVVNFKPNPIRFSKEGGEYTIKVKGVAVRNGIIPTVPPIQVRRKQ